MAQPKIATCSYCGTRAALVLTGTTQHQLSCGNCGAPLSKIRHLKSDEAPGPGHRDTSSHGYGQSYAAKLSKSSKSSKHAKPKKSKKKKSRGRKLWGEVFDIIEDIID